MQKIRLFGEKQVRSIWDEERELWFFSIVDVVGVLTDSPNPRKYWSVLKTRLKKEGSQLATSCSQLKLTAADDKTGIAEWRQSLLILQSGLFDEQPLRTLLVKNSLTNGPRMEQWRRLMTMEALLRKDCSGDAIESVQGAVHA